MLAFPGGTLAEAASTPADLAVWLLARRMKMMERASENAETGRNACPTEVDLGGGKRGVRITSMGALTDLLRQRAI